MMGLSMSNRRWRLNMVLTFLPVVGLFGCGTSDKKQPKDVKVVTRKVVEKPPAPVVDRANLNFDQAIFFKLNSSVISEEGKNLLVEYASKIIDHRLWIQIEGYTDQIGEPQTNLNLAQARAQQVYHFLVRQGVLRQRLAVVSYGESRSPKGASPDSLRRVSLRRLPPGFGFRKNNK